MPTILEWAGTAPPQNLDAVSLQAVAQAESDGDFQRPLYSEVDGLTDRKNALYWTAPRVSLRSIEQGDWKLIHVLEQMDQDELYALQPGSLYEDKNILSAEPQRYQEMLQGLSAWFNLR